MSSAAHTTARVWPWIAIPLGMLMLSYASVPLYRVFCQVTGFGGTTQLALAAPGAVTAAAPVAVRLNTDTDPALPWKFEAVERNVSMKIGEQHLAVFKATNMSDQMTRGHAVYNVTPHEAGKYFNKIECFCFTEQKIAPHETVNFPVSFFIDPAILEDKDLKDLRNITLSYTFFSYESRNQ